MEVDAAPKDEEPSASCSSEPSDEQKVPQQAPPPLVKQSPPSQLIPDAPAPTTRYSSGLLSVLLGHNEFHFSSGGAWMQTAKT